MIIGSARIIVIVKASEGKHNPPDQDADEEDKDKEGEE
jgi:hypothetical protein